MSCCDGYVVFLFFFFKQKTAYEMRISDWSSDVCSSDLNAREFGGGLWDWLPPATVANLVTKKIVMPPAQTSCQIPAEVRQASGEMMIGNLNAFGPEASFSYPPKPAGNAAWNIDWTAKARFRSHTMLMIGADFGGMGGRAGGDRKSTRLNSSH